MVDTLFSPGSASAPAGPDAAPGPPAGGHILVDQFVAQGVAHVACVPGESYRAVLDALHDARIGVITCRAEGKPAILHCLLDPRARPVGRDVPEGQPL